MGRYSVIILTSTNKHKIDFFFKMNEKNLIKKIQTLKQIEPEKDWVVLTKRQIVGFEDVQMKPSFIDQVLEVFQVLPGFNYKLALATLAVILTLGGTIGFSQAALPGDLLYPVRKFVDKTGYLFVSKNDQPKLGLEIANKRLEELTMIAQNNQGRNLAPAINEFRQSMVEAADKLKIVDGSPKITEEIVKETGKLKENREKVEALGVVVGETKELNRALSQLVEREIKDLESRSLTEEQIGILTQAKQDFKDGSYEKALEGILILSYPQP